MTIEPMDDAELAALRHIHEREGLSLYPPGSTAFDRLFARLDAERTRADAAEAERDAAVERAVQKWRPIDDEAKRGQRIIAAEEGGYLVCDDDGGNERPYDPDIEVVRWSRRANGWVSFGLHLASFQPVRYMPLPDLPTPTAAQEG